MNEEEKPDLKIEFSLNTGGMSFPFSITIDRAKLDDVVSAIVQEAAGSVGLMDLLRRRRG